MHEVSCRVFDVIFRRLKEKGTSPELLVEGTSLSLAVLRNRNERIDWADLVVILKNSRKVFTPEDYAEMGRRFLLSPMMRFVSVVARLLFSPMDFYRWINKAQDGVGNQMFTCVVPSQREISDSELEVELRLLEGYEPCPEFFMISVGMFEEMPRLVGAPRARVELETSDQGGRYRIFVPPGDPLVARARRALMWPFTARAAARELKEAHETLQQRYQQLEGARVTLDQQARQLRTAQAVSQLVHGDLDLGRTLEVITRAVVDEAGFVGAEVQLATEVDGVRLTRTARHGTTSGATKLERGLRGHNGRSLGKIRVFGATQADVASREEVLDAVVSPLSLAIDNAVSYEIVEGYRRDLELRVTERTLELSAARDDLAHTVQDLERAKVARDRIFANVNHEIRTPLSLILLALAQARTTIAGAANPEGERALTAIDDSARRLLRMVDDMLLLSQGREREMVLAHEPLDFAELVSRVVTTWKPAADAAGIALDVETCATCAVRGDPDALGRVLMNLLSNALKFTPRGGRVEVRLSTSDDRATLEVSDTGVGIDGDLRARLFGRFERGQRAVNTHVAGSGLGLSLVKEIVGAHGGEIGVDAREGGGSRFHVVLPVTRRALSLRPVKTLSLEPRDFGGARDTTDVEKIYEPKGTAAATVMIAEDDPELRERIARLLAEEYRVVAVGDGATALRLAEVHHPDLLVTDVAMPEMDGFELTRRFRQRPGNRLVPILVVTAFGGIGDRLSGFDAGAVDYIQKPFDPSELRARIRSQLATRGLALRLLEAEKLAALGTMSTGLAHELRNPANGVVNAIEPLRELLPPELLEPGSGVGELLGVMEQCGGQIAAISRHLLGFRRGVEVEQRTIPIESLLTRVRATSRPALEGVELRERLEYRGPVRCAEALMTHALTNLLDNAAAAAGRGGWVELRTRIEGERVIVEFTDSGPGVPRDLRERVFEPFFTTKPPGSGTGLGLSTARDIVLRHGGLLDIRDALGRTVFHVEMPLPAN